MRLLSLVLTDAETAQIEAVFKQNPDLSLNLIKLVNSAATGVRTRIVSLKHAITVLGRKQLQRWLQLLMFTLSSAPAAEFPSPLLVLAATRGKLMELIASALKPSDRDFHDRAFMAGILSLVNALLGLPMAEIVGSVPLAQDVKQALLERSGELGHMLLLVEALEESDLLGIEKALDSVPGLAHSQVIGMQVEAMGWANSIAEAV
jgi:EAL and modified HD-GYP domain-containing signal transduction protein